MSRFMVAMFVAAAFSFGGALGAERVLVEAEGFKTPGGWVVDQQFMDQMGSPYLLAHGLGKPVANATTEVELREGGQYRLWVRTKDWAPPHHPGRFKVSLNGKAVDKEFGVEGKDWLWQDGGKLELAKGKLAVELQDLTGFEGRCDAIFLTSDAQETPPAKVGEEMRAWRKKLLGLPDKPAEAGEFDLVVIGGGMAGSCSAAAAAQKGLKVALIQDRPVLGGNASPEIRVPVGGLKPSEKYPKVCETTKKNIAEMRKGLKGVPNLQVFTWMHAFAVEKSGDRITAVMARNCLSGAESRFAAPLFVDCTGDGTIGFLAGAEFRYGREGRNEFNEVRAPDKADKLHMGMTLYWSSKKVDGPSAFPACPWAIVVNEKNFTSAAGKGDGAAAGSWDWETGFHDVVPDSDELCRDRLLRAIYGTWDYQKNRMAGKEKWANVELMRVNYVVGKRESRRLVGDVLLTEQDVSGKGKPFADGCVSLGWGIDLHLPTPGQTKDFPGEEFRSGYKSGGASMSFLIPLRSLYSKDVANLMMAGRCISVTHVALGTVRVMGTTAQMGTCTGLAASICRKRNCTPREVYQKHLEEFQALLKDPAIE